MQKLTEEEKIDALRNYTPHKPHKQELGGGYYYTCHWGLCRETLTKWYNYCPKCGQRIDWSEK